MPERVQAVTTEGCLSLPFGMVSVCIYEHVPTVDHRTALCRNVQLGDDVEDVGCRAQRDR